MAENDESYSSLMENIPIGVYRSTPGPRGAILMANPALLKIAGFSSEDEFKGENLAEFYEDPAERSAFSELLLANGSVSGVELRLKKKDGTPFWGSVTGRVIRDQNGEVSFFDCTLEDITVRKKAEEALQFERSQFLSIFDSINEIIYVADPRTYEILYVNEAGRKALPDDPVGGICYRVFQNRQEPCQFCTNEIIMANKDRPYQWEYHNAALNRDYIQIDRVIRWPDERDVRFEMALDITERKQMEEALRKSEESLLITLNSISDGVIATDRESRITRMNPAAEHLTGWSLAEAVGLPLPRVFQIFNVLTGEQVPDPTKRVLHTGAAVGLANHTALLARDGTMRQIADNAAPIRDSKGNTSGVVLVFSDVTEDYATRQALQESELRNRALLDAIPDLIFIFNRDGVFLDYHSTNPDQLILPAESFLNQHLSHVLPSELAQLTMEALNVVFQRGQPHIYEYMLVLDGKQHHYEGRMVPCGEERALAIIREITEKKLAEKNLQASEERYRLLVDNANEAIIVAQDGMHKFLNPMAVDFYAYPESELRTTPFIEYIHPDDREMVWGRYSKRMAGEVLQDKYNFRIIAGDGSIKWAEIRSVQIEWEGRPAALNLISDVTESKRYEDRLKYLSLHDQLTGLYNRAFFDGEMDRLCGSREYPITVISIDLDGLKLINDTMGHEKGDALLKVCAEILKQTLRRSDILARIGGDEFVAILPRSGGEIGEEVGRRIQEKVFLYNSEHPELPLGLSFGIATAENDSEPLVKILKKSDDRMYRDKICRRDSTRSLIVDIFLNALAERDYINEGHGDRLSALCINMGEKLNLSSQQLVDLALLGQVHDLGKVGIPDSILFKEGPLSDAEWEIMRQHPEKGYYMALSSPDMAEMAELILRHHEWWDGRGYPQGLKGREIPVECLIFAIADAYDAMTNNRPYRRTLSREEAIAELKKCAGTQFAPELVDIFLSSMEQEQ